MSLYHAYVFAMSGSIIGAFLLPAVWWRPTVFGPLVLYIALLTALIGTVLMAGATP